jgi:two-component system NtrC family response regulator
MADSPTVLVLDDDPGVRTSLARLLQRYGYGAVTAATLEEAQALVQSRSIQALILDVLLQEQGTGLDFLRAIRGRPEFQKAPILIFTGSALSEADEMFITRYRAFLFRKPEGFDALVKFLDDLTGRDRPH